MQALSCAFLLSAAGFMAVIGVYSNEEWALAARKWTKTAAPYAVTAARTVNDMALQPAGAWLSRQRQAAMDWAFAAGDNETPTPAKAAVAVNPKPKVPPLKPAINEHTKRIVQSAEAPADDEETLPPAIDPHPPSAAEYARVEQRLRSSISKELFDNFKLFLYVSKAESGPWAQRMYAFDKAENGKLSLLYSWPVSTGREQHEVNSRGVKMYTNTPPGYYQLDGGRMHKHYLSMQWQHPMPYTMFFKWEKDGMPTGLAIHAASGDTDVARLGNRASAGCVRLAPRNAQILFNLVRGNYRGVTPLFAYDEKTATIHNDGLLMHDAEGKPIFAKGYQVLVFIENYGGENVVAALF